MVAHNLSRIVTELPDKFLAINRKLSWHVDMVNYLVTWQLLIDLTAQNKRFFLSNVRNYRVEEPFLFKYCGNQTIRTLCLQENGCQGIVFRTLLEHSYGRCLGIL